MRGYTNIKFIDILNICLLAPESVLYFSISLPLPVHVPFNNMIPSLSTLFILSATLAVNSYLNFPAVSCLNNPLRRDAFTLVFS